MSCDWPRATQPKMSLLSKGVKCENTNSSRFTDTFHIVKELHVWNKRDFNVKLNSSYKQKKKKGLHIVLLNCGKIIQKPNISFGERKETHYTLVNMSVCFE